MTHRKKYGALYVLLFMIVLAWIHSMKFLDIATWWLEATT